MQVGDLKSRTSAQKDVQDAAVAVIGVCDRIENALHNPKAEVVYDVLAGREGGAKLYSQLSPLYTWAQDSDHAPTQGMLERKAELLTELAAREAEIAALRAAELAQLERLIEAAKLPRFIVPDS